MVEFLVTFIMVAGLFCTLSVKIPGTLLILLGATLYGVATGFVTFTPAITGLLILIPLTSELGGRILRVSWTGNCSVSRAFSVNSAVCHFAGMLASNALLGSFLGVLIWEVVAGKTLIPHSNTVSQVLLRLIGVASIRFICGTTMIVIIHLYIFM